MSQAIYDMITARICELLEKGVIPWRKPWKTRAGDFAPHNIVSKKPYRGINVFLLASLGYSSPYWMTYKQANNLGGHVRKGEKGAPVIFWQMLDRPDRQETDKDGQAVTRKIPMLRYYTVFNADQVEGIEAKTPGREAAEASKENTFSPIEEAARIIEHMPNRPQIITRGLAAYSPALDVVAVPPAESFVNPESYYATAFHELAHSTGHPSRLNREGITDPNATFGSQVYSREELVAEMGAAFLCGEAGIAPAIIENSAAYINSWLSRLRDKENRRWLVTAAAQASKAADFILAGAQARAQDGGLANLAEAA